MTNILSAIEKRRSVRTFDPSLPVDKSLLATLRDKIRNLSFPTDCGCVKIDIIEHLQDGKPQKLGKYGIVAGARHFLTISTSPGIRSEVTAGFMAEQPVLWLTGQGIGSVWVGGVPDREAFARQHGVDEGLTLAAIIPFGYAARPRLMERLMRTVASASTRKPFEKLFFRTVGDGTVVPLSPSDIDNDIRQVLEAVRLAPSSLNGQPWRFVAEGERWYVYGDYKTNAGTDEERMKHLDLGIAICHFSLAYQQLTGRSPLISFNSGDSHFTVPSTWHPIAEIAADSPLR